MEKRNKQIDSIRGIVAIVILVFHLFCRYLQIYENSSIIWMEHWGTFGIVVFILISGYLLGIENIKKRSLTKKFSLIEFLKKKFLRLWPCYIIAITIIMIVIKFTELPGREVTFLDYILNIFFVNGFCGVPYVDGAHWYLTTLIAITFIIGIAKKIRLNDNIIFFMLWLLIVGLFIKLGYGNITVFAGEKYLGVTLIGYSIAKIMNSDNKRKNWIILLIFSTIFCTIIQGITTLLIIIISLLLVIPCFLGKFKGLEKKILFKLGNISYPLYLIHQNIGYVIIRELTKINGEYQIYFSIVACICTFALAIIIYFVEKIIEQKLTSS